MQIAICELGYFPRGRKAPDRVQPNRDISDSPDAVCISGDELIVCIGANLAAMDTMLNRIEPQAEGAPVLTHMALGPLSVRRWRRFHRTHARHHAAQIRNAVQSA